MERQEEMRLERFFDDVVEELTPERSEAVALVVTHLVRDRPFFLRALDRVLSVGAVLPKPRSIDPRARAVVEAEFPVVAMDRRRMEDLDWVCKRLDEHADDRPVVLVDIGGYFAATLEDLAREREVLGVVEDTENGFRRYRSTVPDPPCPVISVARSPLKEAEDHLVGRSVVFSTEALMRTRGDVLSGRSACVIGYGKIGRSIAMALRSHGVNASVVDRDPIKLTEAHAHGFDVHESLADGLSGAALVMCATGNYALRQGDFSSVADGAYVASVTSSDDELELGDLRRSYRRSQTEHDIVRYRTDRHYFFVLNRGDAVNFVHGAVVGPAIHLVQAEIVAGVARMCAGQLGPGHGEVSAEDRRRIAEIWLAHFR